MLSICTLTACEIPESSWLHRLKQGGVQSIFPAQTVPVEYNYTPVPEVGPNYAINQTLPEHYVRPSWSYARQGKLTEAEMQMARRAWVYFENNYQPATGLVNSVDGYPSTTMWDTASYLGGLVAALEFNIIEKDNFDLRMTALLKTLNRLSFFRDELPNKAYNTETAEKVDYTNQPGEIGYSALDLGRMLIWFTIIKERYPEFANEIDLFVLRWNFCNMIDENGTTYGALINEKTGRTEYVQEGRLGYEEYAAKGFQLWGFDTTRATLPEPYETVPIYGIDVPYDLRDPRSLHAHNYVVSESYILDGLEFDWDLPWDKTSPRSVHTHGWVGEFADRIYQVQERRYNHTGIVTARSEHQLDGPPYFVYDTIYTDGYPWNTISEVGEFIPQFSAVALKAALGMWVLWDTEYTDIIWRKMENAFNKDKGFYEGIYENGNGYINTFTANNNGIMLESLLYKEQGKLLRFTDHPSRWEQTITDPFYVDLNCIKRVKPCCGDKEGL